MNLQESIEALPAPFHALIVWVMSVTGCVLAILGGRAGAAAIPLLYGAGFLQRHFSDPAAHPFLDSENHGKSWFHPGFDTVGENQG